MLKVDLLDCESSHVRSDASTFVLGVAGIKPAADPNISLRVGLEIHAGYVIDLSGRRGRDEGREREPAPRIIDVTPAKPADQ
jgi:hypothetical protein